MFGLLLSPVKGVVWLAEVIYDEAQRQYSDPATVMRAIEDVESARQAGQLTDTEAADMEAELMERLYPPRPAASLLPHNDEESR